jgi:hypothetical protein
MRRLIASAVLLLLIPIGWFAGEIELWTAASYLLLFHVSFFLAAALVGLGCGDRRLRTPIPRERGQLVS